MTVRATLGPLVFASVLIGGCGGSSGGSTANAGAGSEAVFGAVATRAVGDGLRKPVIVSTTGATFVGLAGATFTNVALVNPPAPRVGEDTAPLAYVGSRAGDLMFVHPATGRTRTITSTTLHADLRPTVSPDGWRTVYTDAGGIRIVNLDGSGGAILKPQPATGIVHRPSFAPDGLSIVYVQNYNSGVCEIRRMSVDGTNDRLVFTPSASVDAVVMTSGGVGRIIYAMGANIWMVRSDGTENRILVGSTAFGLGLNSAGHLYFSTLTGIRIQKSGDFSTELFSTTDIAPATFSLHPQLPFLSFRKGGVQTDVHRAAPGTAAGTLVRSLQGFDGRMAFVPYRERRDVVIAGTADPQGAGFVASQLGRFAGSIVGWDAQNRAATAVVAEPVLSGSDSVVFTVDAGANNKITRVFSLDSIWEGKSTLSLPAPVDGLVITFDTLTGLPGAIIPYVATRGTGKPKITQLAGGAVRVEGELTGVYGEGGKLLSGPTSVYETGARTP